MAGRPPTPIELHKTRGTFRATRHKGKLVAADKRLGAPPDWFDDVAKNEWNRLAGLPHIRSAHAVAAERACCLYSRFVQDVKGTRLMTSTERSTFHSIYMQLGLTPSSQAKVLQDQKHEYKDAWADLG